MNKDDIIRMGHEADAYANCKWNTETPAQDWKQYRDEHFANLVAAAEREACMNCYSPDDSATDWMDKIKARSQS